jgi:hypothetical protein
MSKAERIRRKLANAEQLTREAYELAGDVDRTLKAHLARAVDAAGQAGDDFKRYESQLRAAAEARAREAAELEEYGRCTKCNTGVSAAHSHCETCGWPIDTFGSWAGTCHNRDCELYRRPKAGVRYSDKVPA